MTIGATRSNYLLRCSGLSSRMAVQIDTFLVIADKRFAANWHCVDTGTGDAVLRAVSRGGASGLQQQQQLLLGRPGSSLPEAVLTLPLQMEDFVAALCQIEQVLDRSQVPGGHHSATPVELRLRHWPPTHALMAHKYYPRLASFMSRPVTLARLSLLSNVPMECCLEFVDSMQALGIVESPRSAPAAGVVPVLRHSPSAVPVTQTTNITPAVPGRLVERLRARLGIGAPRG